MNTVPSLVRPASLSHTLDPQDWAAFRRLGHQMIDDMADWFSSARTRPTWRRAPENVLDALEAPVPLQGQPADAVYEEFRQMILPYPTGNVHPRFWSHVIGSGTPFGALAQFLEGAMNCNLFGGEQVGCRVEAQVLRWLAGLLGYPESASGILLSGGSMANIVGLTVALRRAAGPRFREEGLQETAGRFRFYCSAETHNSLEKAAELLGLGSRAVRRVAVDRELRLDLAALASAVHADRRDGCVPFCVVGNAITVGTGVIDPLPALADFCAAEQLWLHIDGAIGAVARITPELHDELAGLDRADSVAFDLHKWMHIPYEAGCLLVRDGEHHREAFANSTAYLAVLEGGLSSGRLWPNQLGPELSRGFKALKVWMSFKEHGVEGFARAMSANIRQAALLTERINAEPKLELLAPTQTCIVNFRFRPVCMTDGAALDALNRRILIHLQESGHSVPSHNRIGGRFAIRVAITNHRTTADDLESLAATVVMLGERFGPPHD